MDQSSYAMVFAKKTIVVEMCLEVELAVDILVVAVLL